MQQFQSLKRILIFYSLTLAIMLVLYYAMMFVILRNATEQHTQDVFDTLAYELSEHQVITDDTLKDILASPLFQSTSYQLVLILPSGQTHIYRNTRQGKREFTTVSFPDIKPQVTTATSAYKLTTQNLTGIFNLENGQRIYAVLRHRPIDINLILYQYWLPLITAIMLLIMTVLYIFRRRDNWELLLLYIDNLTTNAQDTYMPPPFDENKSTIEFLRLGHALSRVSYQLHSKHRRIKRLSHRLERLVAHAPLPVLMIMRQGQISYSNQRFEQLFNTTINKHHTAYTITDFVIGSDKAVQQQLLRLDSQRVTRTLIVYGLEDQQAYQLHLTPWFSDHGQIHGFTAVFNNVNELVSQNTELQQQNQHLNQQILELSRLKSIIGHELRTPLNAIIGTLDLIEPSTLSQKQQEVVTTLTQSSHSMLTMLNDMLDMAKIEAGKLDITHEPVDIFKLTQHVRDLTVGNTRRKNIEFMYFFTADCPRYIYTDNNRLRQILLNLIDNAVKFTASGYVALIIEPISHENIRHIIKEGLKSNHQQSIATPASYQWLEKITSAQQEWLNLRIQDTGIGISTVEQSQLFSYFNQANEQINQQFGGTGLGLAISSSFAQLLGGFIQLTSEQGVGSTFNLYLPIRQPTYQPIYQFHNNLKKVHLIAIVNHELRATYLERLCQYLCLRATIYSHFDDVTLQQVKTQLSPSAQTHAPVLLLDYEYYLVSTTDTINSKKQPKRKRLKDTDALDDSALSEVTMENNAAFIAAFYELIAMTALPKILLSMKPERGIPSSLLDQFDGFLTKPLDIAHLLSELMRLTTTQVKSLNNKNPIKKTKKQAVNKEGAKNLTPDTTESINTPIITENNNHPTDHDSANDEAHKPLILVVEDNLTNQKITCKLLSKLGFDSIVAEDGQQALDKLQQHRQDIALILMDCRMPVMDGLQATQAIRAQGDPITVIALTANNSEEDRIACLAAGMDEFLTKPINKDKLKIMLNTFMIPL